MAEHVEVVIKIPKYYLTHPQDYTCLAECVKRGVPLPKGHGDLIDRSTLEPDTEWSEWYDDWVSYSYGQIADADVVIKADGGGEDENGD